MPEEILHKCVKTEDISGIAKQVSVLQFDLDEHRAAQQEQDKAREKNRFLQREHDKVVDEKLDTITIQMRSLIELNAEYVDMKTAWKVGKRMGLGLALFIGVVSIITGGVFALKNWIKG